MPLVTSGEISIGGSTANRSINLELGRSATASSNLNETALRTLAGVPSGAISLSDFYGKSNFAATLNAADYVRFTNSPASFQVNTDGFVYASNGTTQLVQQYQWLTGIGTGSDYEVLASIVSGSVTGDSLSVWLPLSSNRQWNRGALAGQLQFATISVQIRMAASPNTVLAGPVNINIECDRS
jgi:hypothetical protein